MVTGWFLDGGFGWLAYLSFRMTLYCSRAEADIRNIGPNPKLDWGMDGDDIHGWLQLPEFKGQHCAWKGIAKKYMKKEKFDIVKKMRGVAGEIVKQVCFKSTYFFHLFTQNRRFTG